MGSNKPVPSFSPIRACLFDMDGLLLNTEDLYTASTNAMLNRYGRPNLPWRIKAQLQGRPGPAASAILHEWAQLPIPPSQYHAETAAMQEKLFPTAAPLPGVEQLLADLQAAGIHIALATSSHAGNFKLKTDHLQEFFKPFTPRRRVMGDDPRIPMGRGKPAPEIYLLALEMINETLPPGEEKVKPEECLVLEDSVPGVESGRRAGMRVIWCPHPELYKEFKPQQEEVLAGRVDVEGGAEGRGELGDGWGRYLVSLENFPYQEYGIVVKRPSGLL